MGHDVDEEARRYRMAVLDFSDISTSVLKGHLFVEEAIEDLLAAHVRNPAALAQARLSFSAKVQVLRALTECPDHGVWQFAYRLNTARNHLAHSLERDKAESIVKELILDCESILGREHKQEESMTVQIARLIGFIVGTLRRRMAPTVVVKTETKQEKET
jgi:hypothetical protein